MLINRRDQSEQSQVPQIKESKNKEGFYRKKGKSLFFKLT